MKLKKIARLNRKVLEEYNTNLARDMKVMMERIVPMIDNLGMMEDNAEKKLNKVEARNNKPVKLDLVVRMRGEEREMRHLHANIVGMNEVLNNLQGALALAYASMLEYAVYMEEFDKIMSQYKAQTLDNLVSESLAYGYSTVIPKSENKPDATPDLPEDEADEFETVEIQNIDGTTTTIRATSSSDLDDDLDSEPDYNQTAKTKKG